MRRTIGILLGIVILFGCSMPATSIYSLSIEQVSTSYKSAYDFPLGLVLHSPQYLSQAYIASRSSPYELRISKYSKWEAPPDRMVGESFRDFLFSAGIFQDIRIFRSPRKGLYNLELKIRRFERLNEGGKSYGLLTIDTIFSDNKGKLLFRKVIADTQELAGNDYASLAKGMSILMKRAYEELEKEILSHPSQ